MYLPPGMAEEQVLATITTVARRLALKFAFGPYTVEDLEQEAHRMAIEALPRYNPTTGPLENFLHRHVKLRLVNFKRDHLRRCDSPCPACLAALLSG